MDLLLSKDLKQYLKEQNRTFTDAEVATLIFNSEKEISVIHEELMKIKANTEDKLLAKEIEERIEYDKASLDKISEAGEDILFTLEIKEDGEYENEGYFREYRNAKEYADTFHEDYVINKVRFSDQTCRLQTANNDLGSVTYDKNGNARYYWSIEMKQETYPDFEEKDRFENSYISIPHPFRNGDIVKNIATGRIGIVTCFNDQADWEEYDNSMKTSDTADFSDAMVTVEFLYDDGCFSHDHIRPMYLEFAELEDRDIRKELFLNASRLMKGKGSLEYFQMLVEEYSNNKKMRNILKTICKS